MNNTGGITRVITCKILNVLCYNILIQEFLTVSQIGETQPQRGRDQPSTIMPVTIST